MFLFHFFYLFLEWIHHVLTLGIFLIAMVKMVRKYDT